MAASSTDSESCTWQTCRDPESTETDEPGISRTACVGSSGLALAAFALRPVVLMVCFESRVDEANPRERSCRDVWLSKGSNYSFSIPGCVQAFSVQLSLSVCLSEYYCLSETFVFSHAWLIPTALGG